MVAVVGPTVEVVVEDAVNGTGAEKGVGGTEGVFDEGAEDGAEPVVGGDVEAFLLAVEDGVRDFTAHELAEEVFELAAVDL